MRTEKLKSILFDPISWIHPQRFVLPALFDTPGCRSILNDAVISHYALSSESIKTFRSIECCFIDHWHLLPKVAFMLACLRNRSHLALGGQIARLDPAVRQFARLPLIDNDHEIPTRLTMDQLWRRALTELMLFQEQLCDSLIKRVPLLFAESSTLNISEQPNMQPNTLLLRLAIQHAKRIS